MDPITMGMLGASAISGLANIGGGIMSASGAASANAQNIAMQNQQNWANNQFAQSVNEGNIAFQNQANLQNQGLVRETNAQNLEFQRETNAQNAAQAQKQMDFQERLSNSAYQRAMSDMRSAGLNPLLAYQQGGASSMPGSTSVAVSPKNQAAQVTAPRADQMPPGRAAQVQNTQSELGRAMGATVQSALDAARTVQGYTQLQEQIKLTESQRQETDARTRNIDADTSKKGEETTRTRAETERTEAEKRNADLTARVLAAQGHTAETIAKITGLELEDAQKYGTKLTPDGKERITRGIGRLVEDWVGKQGGAGAVLKQGIEKLPDLSGKGPTAPENIGKYTFTPGKGWHLK